MKSAAIGTFLLLWTACTGENGAPAAQPEKIRVISTGSAFRREDYLVPGYFSILELYADW